MKWKFMRLKSRFYLFVFMTILSCFMVMFIYRSEIEMIMERIIKLNELKDKDIQELIKHFGPVLKTIVESLNISVSEDMESLMVAYKPVDMVSSPMAQIDLITFLPHLWSHKDFLKPFVLHSRGRNAVSIVFGIPSVRRQRHNYLIQTLVNFVSNMNQTEQNDSLIVVMIAEVDLEYTQQISVEIKNRLPDAVNSGLVEVISPIPEYYPDFSKFPVTFNDTQERHRWRSKQNLDFAFLMMYCKPKGLFYVQLEDDLITKPRFQTLMKKTALQWIADGKEWFIFDFGGLGFIGKMIRCSDLPWLIQFIVMFYKEKPADWLLDGMMQTKVCHNGKDLKDCKNRKDAIWVKYNQSFFQHMGLWSSLNGKIQRLTVDNF